MDFNFRKGIYEAIEAERQTKVLAFVTGNRPNLETMIAQDCIDCFVDLLDVIGPTNSITLILHTNGGHTLAAWRLVNLLRIFCDRLEVVIPQAALSAGTLISIGADSIVMTKQAALGPIDPSVNSPLNPTVTQGGQEKLVPVSVENVRGYLDGVRKDIGISGEVQLARLIEKLTEQVHPLVLGEIFRSRDQIRFLANKLLVRQVSDLEKVKTIIDFLCADSGSHDYTINRREAADLGLSVNKPSDHFYQQVKAIHQSYSVQLKLLEPFVPERILSNVAVGQPVPYVEDRGLIEGPSGGCYGFQSEGALERVNVPVPGGNQIGIRDTRTFEGWRKIA